jgi:hypothetical protein
VGFFFDRLFFAFAALGFLLLSFFEAFAPFFSAFGRVFAFGLFGVLFFIVFGFEPVYEPAQRPRVDTLGGSSFAGFMRFAAFAGTPAAAGERRAGHDEHEDGE